MNRERIERKLEDAMTVGMLIEELKQLDENLPVLFTCNYGDYGRTQQALPIDIVYLAQDECETVCESAYSGSGLAISGSEENDEDWEDNNLPGAPDKRPNVIDQVVILK